MKVKINGKFMELTEQELDFVREQIGEWEIEELEFEYPVYIPISEIAQYFKKSKQGIHWVARHNGIEVKRFGNTSFIRLEDVIEHWFEALK